MALSTMATETGITVRGLARRDIAAVVKLQGQARALFVPWSHGQLESHLRRFPAGQLLAEQNGAIVGACASLKLSLADGALPESWMAATGQGYFHTHRADGNVLYVASMAISPQASREAVRHVLDEMLLKLARDEGVRRVLAPVRLPGMPGVTDETPPEAVLEMLSASEEPDPVLRGLEGIGFRLVSLLGDHQGLPRAGDRLAALLEWRGEAA